MQKLLASVLIACLYPSAQATVIKGPLLSPVNGRYYALLAAKSWSASQTEALTLGGNLATINSAAENDWIFNTFSAGQKELWIGLVATNASNTYAWVDGSPLVYTDWDVSQPNGGSERWALIIHGNLGGGQITGKWDDVGDFASPVYGVVEFTNTPFCSPHAAAAVAVLTNGALAGVTMTDNGCGYTNAPAVLVQGGGGSGATAIAVLFNDAVIRIDITDPGCCYTNTPKILIGSPPFVPTLSIRFSKVAVTEHVVLGRNYLLEASTDMIHWAATGPQFTATNEVLSQEFDIDTTGRFFRINQVP